MYLVRNRIDLMKSDFLVTWQHSNNLPPELDNIQNIHNYYKP